MILKKALIYQKTLWGISGGIFDSQKAEKRILELDTEISKESFWKDKIRSKKIIREKNFIENILNFYKESEKNLDNLKDLNKNTDIIADQSYSERQLFEKAYERLKSEFEAVLNVSPDDVQKKMDKALGRVNISENAV